MMDQQEREEALKAMRHASKVYYDSAAKIGVHPFIEFAGLINEYIQMCQSAHNAGIDFSECNKHTGKHLPMLSHECAYINEKLECIFCGSVCIGNGD